MLKRKIVKTTEEIKNPHIRLNVQMLIIAVAALASVIVFLEKTNLGSNKEKIEILNVRIDHLQEEIKALDLELSKCEFHKDSMTREIQEERKETIKQLNDLIQKQNKLKK